MVKKKNTSETIEISGFVGDGTAYKATNYQHKTDEKPWIYYDACNKPCYTRETCWKIHRKPANWKSSKQGEQNKHGTPMANEANSSPFNKEQIDHLLQLIKSNSSSSIPSVSLAQIGRKPKALSCLNPSPRIIDSGASEHITSFFSPI